VASTIQRPHTTPARAAGGFRGCSRDRDPRERIAVLRTTERGGFFNQA
jgi:hypothetical protein